MKEKEKKPVKASSADELMAILTKWSDKIRNLARKTERIAGKTPEIIALGLYTVLHFLVTMVHEPWFDEALAWMIARDSSIYELLFEVPHYEGHPALWHLVLMPFAKSGAPYELSLSIVSFIFAGGAVALLLFKSKLPRIIRLLMPFTYFFFYQFGVVARPYCMMMLAFFVMAVCFERRNEHPFGYTASMLFLCATSAYGIVIAGGLAVCWLVEIWKKAGGSNKNISDKFRNFMSMLVDRKKILWLALLLGYALFTIWRIIPAEDAYAAAKNADNGITGVVIRLIYMVFGSVADCFVTNTFSTGTILNETGLSLPELCVSVLVGAGILFLIIRRSRKSGMTAEFVVPYLFITVFSAFVYASRHHIGIILLFLVFFIWVTESDGNRSVSEKEAGLDEKRTGSDENRIGSEGKKARLDESRIGSDGKKAGSDENRIGIEANKAGKGKVADLLVPIVYFVCLLIPLYWSISTSVIEVFSSYSWGHSEAEFIKENGLEDYVMLAQWESMPALKNSNAKPEGAEYVTVAENTEDNRNVADSNIEKGIDNRSEVKNIAGIEKENGTDIRDTKSNGDENKSVNTADDVSSAITFSSRVTYLLPYLREDNFLNSVHQLGTGFGMLHRIPSETENAALTERIKNSDKPDIVLGSVSFSAIYGPFGINEKDYVCVHSEKGGSIWKGVPEQMESRIFVKKEIAEMLGMKEIK